jgi:SAM-dependent methyltransferase
MSCYSSYAPVYDATGQGRVGAGLARQALAWLRGHGQAPRAALDLACGTGGGAFALAEAGMQVIGVDASPAMLVIARGRARGAGLDVVFVEGDIRNLPAAGQWEEPGVNVQRSTFDVQRSTFHLVICFGALNELAGDGDLAQVFGAAAALLRPQGHLAFDLWDAEALLAGDETDVVLHDGPDHLVYARRTPGEEGEPGERRIVWFVREIDRWWRGEEAYPLRAWREEEVREALRSAGLTLAEQWPAEGDALGDRTLHLARLLRGEG